MNVYFVSLGCDKNLVDSEVMLALLAEKGHTITSLEEEAEVAVVNTCCFIHDAKEESIQAILEMAELKKKAKLKGIVVTGCLSERYRKEMEAELPEADVILGTSSYGHIVEAVDDVASGRRGSYFEPIDRLPEIHGKRMVSGVGFSSYLKIAEGCDKCCTYCVIPQIRGRYRSVSMEYLVEEAVSLAAQGIRELILVAQETTLYGVDLYGEKRLPELLRQLCRVDGLDWIRLLYCYPEEITEDLIRTMKEEPKICHYLDMPVQHASDRILKKMGRRTDRAELVGRIGRIREEIPDIVLRTTLITGFPGETEEDFQELMEFVDEMEFDRLGVFTYSPEEGTPAEKMDGQVPEEEKERRREEIMALQQEIAAEHGERQIGRILPVLIEGRLPEEEKENPDDPADVYMGRTYMDAPGVDGFLFVPSERELISGERVLVRVTGAGEYDLYGELTDGE